ncbi:murein hydrolase activator EnvC family protein [Culicoidibacter larvae]|uniref:Uncharacterized protein n=1 Tax=Culicoidibacter larvae TaxID=2579976 RepID=A0A5R8QH95_9FIRM|nr:peptidoglycan DD-metalloendopeptidase family protein [Culicoidibacter larvae]TLG77106.1 hypothetical protein FEZ08_00375 [Culicoidibacter larvae]
MKSKTFKIILSAALLVAVVGVMSYVKPEPVQACDTVEECQAEYDRIREEREANQSKLAGYKDDYEGIISKISTLNDSITQTEAQISVIEATIVALQTKIDELQASIDAKNELVMGRMEAMQLQNKGNVYIDFILNASSLADMVSRSEAITQITQADKDLIHQIREQKDEIVKSQDEQVTKQNELIAVRDDLQSQKDEQDQLQIALIEKIHASEALEEELALAEDTSAQQLANISGKVPPTSGAFGLPTANGIITAGYLDPDYGFSSDHLGTDIAWNYGSEIYSIGTGVVAETVTGCGGCTSGYGNYVVMIYNKNNVDYAVMYGHLSSVYVSPGQVVSQGSAIGAMGSTGFSTGPHLHLEILRGINYFPASRYQRLNYVINTKEVISYPGNRW